MTSIREHVGPPIPPEREPGDEQPEYEEAPEPPKPKHRATYARDKREGGYLIRVAGPYPEKFAEKEVPVTLKNGDVKKEHLTALIWTGNDRETGQRVALYRFERQARQQEELPF